MSGFTKDDAGKPRFDLLDPYFLEGLAKVLTHGAKKYSADNWVKCTEPHERYYSALQRHLNAYALGSSEDSETGLSHLYHAGCCLMFLAHFERTGQLCNPPTGWRLTPMGTLARDAGMDLCPVGFTCCWEPAGG